MVESSRGAFAPLGANLTLTSKLFQSSMLLADIVTISIDEFVAGKEESKSNRFLDCQLLSCKLLLRQN